MELTTLPGIPDVLPGGETLIVYAQIVYLPAVSIKCPHCSVQIVVPDPDMAKRLGAGQEGKGKCPQCEKPICVLLQKIIPGDLQQVQAKPPAGKIIV